MPNFTRTIENFICEHCGSKVKGNGYTNHCAVCLYSKHVDNNPGDRANACQALMRPIDITIKNGAYIIRHKCESCGKVKNNKAAPGDNVNLIIKIASDKQRQANF